jgi:hypothetical protein
MRLLGILICMAVVASLFVLVIGLGFELNEGQPPLGSVSAPAGGALILSFGALVWYLNRNRPWAYWGAPFFRPKARGPVTPVVKIDTEGYAADPSRVVTCTHLQPIEAAMRAAGIPLHWRYGTVVAAQCVIDDTRLQVAPPVHFHPDMPGDRPGDPGWSMISCHEHSSVIGTIHRAEATPTTPVFPLAR